MSFCMFLYGVRLKQVFGDTALESSEGLFEIPERVRVAVFASLSRLKPSMEI